MKTALLLCLIALGLALDEAILLQKPSQDKLKEIFSKLAEDGSEQGQQLFVQLQAKVQAGATFHNIEDHISELRTQLEADSQFDVKKFQDEQVALEKEYEDASSEIEEIKKQRDYLDSKLEILIEQSELIDNLFASDSDAYTTRVGTQNAMLETISILIEKINQHLLEGHSFVEKEDLFEELKAIGRGNHIEVLAQLTAHLDSEQVAKILSLFDSLKTAIQESLAADEAKEQANIELHNKLRAELGELIPKVTQQVEDAQNQYDSIIEHASQAHYELQELGVSFQNREDYRRLALEKTIEAQKLLQDHLETLSRWEGLQAS
ncbi:hypothetical protein pb186bvf_001139 [Paramecium bursaria]